MKSLFENPQKLIRLRRQEALATEECNGADTSEYAAGLLFAAICIAALLLVVNVITGGIADIQSYLTTVFAEIPSA